MKTLHEPAPSGGPTSRRPKKRLAEIVSRTRRTSSLHESITVTKRVFNNPSALHEPATAPGKGNRLQPSYASIAVAVFLLFLGGIVSSSGSELPENARERSKRQFSEERDRFKQNPNDPEAGWKFGRACFHWAEFSESNLVRTEIADQGISACKRSIELRERSAAAHYFLALNIGQLAKTKRLSALGLVDDMERELKRAIELDPKLERGAPDRSLGLLYFQAPGWPLSIGDKRKAMAHLERAVEIKPDYPENRLCVLETFLHSKDQARLLREIKDYRETLPRARSVYAGPEWAEDWLDWDARWNEILRHIPGK